MKKILCVFFALVTVFVFSACGTPGSGGSGKVLRVESESYDGTAYSGIKKTERFKEEDRLGETVSFSFLGKEYRGTYDETLIFNIGDFTTRFYKVEGTNGAVGLTPDGAVEAVLFDFGKLDIDPFSSETEIRECAEAYLADEIDFSEYDHCFGGQSIQGGTETGFGLYLLTWYKTVGGISTDDWIQVRILDTGEIGCLRMKNRHGYDFSSVKEVDPEQYLPLIEEEARRVFGNQYVGVRMTDNLITKYKGEMYLSCDVSVKYHSETASEEGKSSEMSSLMTFLIKLDE